MGSTDKNKKACSHRGCPYNALGNFTYCTFHRKEDKRAKHSEQTKAYRERVKAIKLGLLPVGGRKRRRAFKPVDVPCYWCMRYYNPAVGKCPDCGTPYDPEKTKKWEEGQRMSYLDHVAKKEGAAGVARVKSAREMYSNDKGFDNVGVNRQLEVFLKRTGYSIRRFNNRKEK